MSRTECGDSHERERARERERERERERSRWRCISDIAKSDRGSPGNRALEINAEKG